MTQAIAGIGLIAAIFTCLGCLYAVSEAIRFGADRARMAVAKVVFSTLNILLAATFLRLISLQSWMDIASFVVVFGLRTIVKWSLKQEAAGPVLTVNSRA